MKRTDFIICAAALLATSCASRVTEVELSSLNISAFSSGWSEAKANLSVSGNSLSIAGKTYETGVGTHASSEAHIRLDGQKGRFTACVGVDDHADGAASVIFYVFTNRGVAFRSEVMHKGDAPQPVDVDLNGVTDLCLVVDPTPDGSAHDHANWADAKFKTQTPPAVVIDEQEERYILTPPPAAAPRINGAKITGASAGKPFLFAVAVTGDRPMRFTAENLPAGLTLNAETGVITGVCSEAGAYRVPLTAVNDVGACRDTLDIIIGGALALTPHMGWNSWYVYEIGITQEIMEQSAQAMYDEGLARFGYTYVNIDDGWAVKLDSDDPVIGGVIRNPDGTIRANRNFPDMKRLTDRIHSLGLKAGLYSSPGPATCGGYAGSYGHEAQDVRAFAEWGFDFLKYDWCSYDSIAKSKELYELQKPYRQISRFIREAERDIVLNMCQYGLGDVWKWGKEVGGQSWRTTGDINYIGAKDNLLTSMFRIGFAQGQLKDYAGSGGWNDPDYLLFGDVYDWDRHTQRSSPYSPSEHYTCMTLWCMMAAPLIFSGNMLTLDDFTRNVLCNAEVIDVNQDRLGKAGGCIWQQDLIEIWGRELSDGATAVAIFNKRPLSASFTPDWKALDYAGLYHVRDLWRQQDLGTTDKTIAFDIPRHGCVMLKLMPAPDKN